MLPGRECISMRARVVSLSAVLAVIAAFASPSDAAADPRLVLSGSGYRYIDVTLRRETVLDFFNFLGDHKAMTASYRGDFAGFAVETGDARHRVIGGAVLVRGRVTRTAGGWPDPVGLTDDRSLTLR